MLTVGPDAGDVARLPFLLDELRIRHGDAQHLGVVITPKSQVVVGKERLRALRRADGVNDVERALIAEIQRCGEVRLVFFRAVNADGDRVWQFDPGLDHDELEEAGLVMSHALLPLHRRLMAAGVILMVHTEWGARESIAMRHGIRSKLKQIVEGGERGAVAEADKWLLRNMLLHTALGLGRVTDSLLPPHLTLIDRRVERVRQLADQLPASALA